MLKVLKSSNKSLHLPPLRICPNFDVFLKFCFGQWTPYLFARCHEICSVFFEGSPYLVIDIFRCMSISRSIYVRVSRKFQISSWLFNIEIFFFIMMISKVKLWNNFCESHFLWIIFVSLFFCESPFCEEILWIIFIEHIE